MDGIFTIRESINKVVLCSIVVSVLLHDKVLFLLLTRHGGEVTRELGVACVAGSGRC